MCEASLSVKKRKKKRRDDAVFKNVSRKAEAGSKIEKNVAKVVDVGDTT